MTLDETMARLESLADEKVKARYLKNGSGENLFGVKRGDVRALAKAIKRNHALALELWATGNVDARFLAILLFKPSKLSPEAFDELVRSTLFVEVTDWVYSQLLRRHRHGEALRQQWMTSTHPMAARTGWYLTCNRVEKSPEGLDLVALLDRIEAEMTGAVPEVQWTMNMCLAAIGIHHAEHRARALAIGEALGLYREWKAPKGCTSPFAPIWIAEMVQRQG